MAEQGTKIVGEEESSSQNPGVQTDKYETAARKSGWKPEDEWDGSPEDWVPAKEFIGRQKLYDKIHDLKRESAKQAQRFEQDMTRISQHFAQVQATEFKRAKKQLENELAAAKRDENVDAVAEIAGELKEVEAAAKVAAAAAKHTPARGPTPEFEEWQSQNSWFNKDAEMTADAIAIGTGFAAANPNKSQKDVLDYTSKKIKRMYPEQFEGETKSNGKGKVEDTRVEGGSSGRPAPKRKGQLGVEDLSEMERSVMKTLIKRGALKDVAAKNKRTQQEEYLAQLAERKSAE